MTLAIGGIGNNGVALDILGVLLGGRDLVGGHLGLGLGVAACYFVESGALGFRLVIWARRGRRVLERTLGRLQVGWRGRHRITVLVCLHLRERSRVSRMKSAFFFAYDRLCTPEFPTEGAGAWRSMGRNLVLWRG